MSAPALVSYAGKEPVVETEILSAQERRLRRAWRDASRAYNMFKTGSDTYEIARALDRTEAVVMRWVRDMREHFRGLPDFDRGRR